MFVLPSTCFPCLLDQFPTPCLLPMQFLCKLEYCTGSHHHASKDIWTSRGGPSLSKGHIAATWSVSMLCMHLLYPCDITKGKINPISWNETGWSLPSLEERTDWAEGQWPLNIRIEIPNNTRYSHRVICVTFQNFVQKGVTKTCILPSFFNNYPLIYQAYFALKDQLYYLFFSWSHFKSHNVFIFLLI